MADAGPPSTPELAQSEKTLQAEQELEHEPVVAAEPSHPRDFADWKWKGTVAVIYLTSCINGESSRIFEG